MGDVRFEDVLELALQLSLGEQVLLIDRLTSATHSALAAENEDVDAQPWTDEEIAVMMDVEPMTGAQIVAAGLTGGWGDIGITDSAEWVNEQKRKRQEKKRW